MRIIQDIEDLSKINKDKRSVKSTINYSQVTIDIETHISLKTLSTKYKVPMSKLIKLMVSDLMRNIDLKEQDDD